VTRDQSTPLAGSGRGARPSLDLLALAAAVEQDAGYLDADDLVGVTRDELHRAADEAAAALTTQFHGGEYLYLGPGGTSWLVESLARRCEATPVTRAVLLRSTRSAMNETSVPEANLSLVGSGRASARGTHPRVYSFPNGSELVLRSARQVNALRDAGFSYVGIEQLTELGEGEYELLRKIAGKRTPILATAQPLGTGVVWVADHFVPGFRAQEDVHGWVSAGPWQFYAEWSAVLAQRGALWQARDLEVGRVARTPDDVVRRVLAVDPSNGEVGGDAYAVAVVALGLDGRAYVEIVHEWRADPEVLAERTADLFSRTGCAYAVLERNHGGTWVQSALTRRDVPVRKVWASNGKITRAEPVAELFKQPNPRAVLVGRHRDLERQLTRFTNAPGDTSPDALDAVVWALTELCLGGRAA
jgi:phage terminase large subunit-like protein